MQKLKNESEKDQLKLISSKKIKFCQNLHETLNLYYFVFL